MIYIKKKNKTFTLAELIAVIVILGIVALITIPLVLNLVNDSRNDALKITAKNLADGAKDNAMSIGDGEQLEISGKLPSNGTIMVNENLETATSQYGTWTKQ